MSIASHCDPLIIRDPVILMVAGEKKKAIHRMNGCEHCKHSTMGSSPFRLRDRIFESVQNLQQYTANEMM
jgi:hypothetical protein